MKLHPKTSALLYRLNSVRPSGSGFMALCPSHKDTNPSLSITEAEDRVLIYCHAGCDPAAILKEIGLTWGDLHFDGQSGPTKPPPIHGRCCTKIPIPAVDPQIAEEAAIGKITSSRKELDIIARRDLQLTSGFCLERLDCFYLPRLKAIAGPMRNAEGQVVGLRYRQGKGKWSRPGSQSGLFHPMDLSSVGPIFIAEGFTDTLAILDCELDAVGLASAGDSKSIACACKILRLRDVVVFAHNDAPGEKGARATADALLLHAKSVRIMSAPPGFKDAREWVVAGATKGEILAAANRAPFVRLGLENK